MGRDDSVTGLITLRAKDSAAKLAATVLSEVVGVRQMHLRRGKRQNEMPIDFQASLV